MTRPHAAPKSTEAKEKHRLDEALEEALRQRVTVEVLHSPAAAERIAGLAGLLRFR